MILFFLTEHRGFKAETVSSYIGLVLGTGMNIVY